MECSKCGNTELFKARAYQDVLLDKDGGIEEVLTQDTYGYPAIDEDSILCNRCGEKIEQENDYEKGIQTNTGRS